MVGERLAEGLAGKGSLTGEMMLPGERRLTVEED